MNREYKIKKEELISDGWGKLMTVTYDVADKKGIMKEQKGELYDKDNAVAVLLYNQAAGTVLLTWQFRLATVYKGNKSGMLLEVCAGMIEDLSPDDTVRKEILEETGYSPREIVPVMKLAMSPGVFTEMLYMYVASYTPEDKQESGGGLEEEGELIQLVEIPYVEAMDMIARGEIVDAKTVVLLQYAGLAGLI